MSKALALFKAKASLAFPGVLCERRLLDFSFSLVPACRG
jgi:hypothetical protein